MLLRCCEEAVRGLGLALPVVELPGGPGSEQACAAARQQLLQLQSHLQQCLQDAVAALASSDSSSLPMDVGAGSKPDQLQRSGNGGPGAATATIRQQMVALGEALCAQLPLAHCCNNSACVQLRGASELQLVGGKGCVCGRCR
jgi:hypothetical protein